MRVRKRAITTLATLGLAGTVAFGAVSVATPAGMRQHAGEAGKIGYISLGETVPFVRLVTKSVQDQGAKAGFEVITCDSALDAEKALNCARQFKTQGVKAIVNFQVDESAAPRICEAGPAVPVVSIDIHQAPCEKVFYGADNNNAGKFAGRALGRYTKNSLSCKVDRLFILDQRSAGAVVVARLKGMEVGFKEFCPAVKSVRVNYKGTTDSAIQPVRDALTRFPGKKVALVSVNDDGAIGAIKAAQAARREKDLLVSGQGADPTSFPYLCGKSRFKGWISDTAYFPEKYGNDVIPIVKGLLAGKTFPKEVYVKHKAVTQQNIRTLYPNACK